MTTKLTTCISLLIIIGTMPAKAQTDPTNIDCTAVNSTSLQLTWDQATDASVLGYYLHIERVDGLRIEPDIPSVDLNAKTFDNYDFAGLGKYGTYNITIHSYTSSSNLTEYVETCTTAEDIPDGAPLTFDCSGISTNTISCSWSSLDQVYWNGVQQGYKVTWLSLNVSLMYQKTVDANTTSTSLTGLETGTSYTVLLNPYTNVGDGTRYSTTTAATKGLSVEVVENVMRYYCNEAVPGMIEFSWEEMPCTVYSGTIGGLLVLSWVFLTIICCMSCCGKTSSNNLSLNLFEDSNVRRKNRTDDVDSEDDNNVNDNSIETDDNNDRSLSDEDYEEYEDGFENKGYRSDEDTGSAKGTNTPYQSSKSLRDEADKALDKNGSVIKGTTLAADGRLTATDIELEPIYEDGISTDGDAADSDYDTQSDYEDTNGNELPSYDNKRKITQALPDKSVGKTSKKSVIASNGKNITTNGNIRIKANFPVEQKTTDSVASTIVAEIHATESDLNTQTPENIVHYQSKSDQDNKKIDNLNDGSELDDWGSPIQRHQGAVDAASPGDWSISDKKVDSRLFKEHLEESNTKKVRNMNLKKAIPLLSTTPNEKEPKGKKSDALQFLNQDVKTSKDASRVVSRNASARRHGRQSHKNESDIELDSWTTPIFDSKALDSDTLNGRISHFSVGIESTNVEKSINSRDWGDDDGWGDVFSKTNDRRSPRKYNSQTTNGFSKNETDLTMFQSYDNKTCNSENFERSHESEITFEQNSRHFILNKSKKTNTYKTQLCNHYKIGCRTNRQKYKLFRFL